MMKKNQFVVVWIPICLLFLKYNNNDYYYYTEGFTTTIPSSRYYYTKLDSNNYCKGTRRKKKNNHNNDNKHHHHRHRHAPSPITIVRSSVNDRNDGSSSSNNSNNKSRVEKLNNAEASSPLVIRYFSNDFDTDNDVSKLLMSGGGDGGGNDDGFWLSLSLLALTIVIPMVAFSTYENVVALFRMALAMAMAMNDDDPPLIGNPNVGDGKEYVIASSVIASTLNGVVMPAMAVLFATMTSTTISTLLTRQTTIREVITDETTHLRHLQLLLDVLPDEQDDCCSYLNEGRDLCRSYLIQYASRVIAEYDPTNQDTIQGSELKFSYVDSELNGMVRQLNQMSNYQNNNHDNNNESSSSSAVMAILDECKHMVATLNQLRTQRITATTSTFPLLHYCILGGLAVSILIGFLIETNQVVFVMVGNHTGTQLQLLWSFLVGTFSTLGLVLYDLGVPFTGTYKISGCVENLYILRLTLKASLEREQRKRTGEQNTKKTKNKTNKQNTKNNHP